MKRSISLIKLFYAIKLTLLKKKSNLGGFSLACEHKYVLLRLLDAVKRTKLDSVIIHACI